MTPTRKTPQPDPPPGLPDPGIDVDHYRCLKAKATRGEPRLPKGITATVVDQFGTRARRVASLDRARPSGGERCWAVRHAPWRLHGAHEREVS